ncbi:MAG: hypothetical protein JWM38_680 [Sphingomonas bacterium]|jgi:hypothetical protein|nr:hypothetical protein [Sphingomonas bacterium]MDB5685337.1 hypothetical protein [Sphingomonas bacterium]MDB5717253.1 hypothetical protein [Sphingomonas bacterium]
MSGVTQPEPAEGPRQDDDSPKTTKGNGQGVSSPEPVEGADDTPGGGEGSPRG